MGLQEAGRLGGETEAPADCMKRMWRGLARTCSCLQFTKTKTCTLYNTKVTSPIKCHTKVQDWPGLLGQGLRPHGWPSTRLQSRQSAERLLVSADVLGGLGRWPGLPPEGSDRVGQSWGSRLQVQSLLAHISADVAWPLPVSCIRLGCWEPRDMQLPGAGVGASFPSFLSGGRGHLGILCPRVGD